MLLPFQFDVHGIFADARALDAALWQPHFNKDVYQGDWSGVALRSNGGRPSLYPDPNAPDAFADTPALAQCPHVRDALARLDCDVTSVRFLRLGPGARIFEHQDYGLEYDGGEARLHVCIQSNDDVRFTLDGTLVAMAPGECWYLDVSRAHSVENLGSEPRIHLVIDCQLDARLRQLIAG